MKDDASGLTNHVLATSGLDFKLLSEFKNPDSVVLSAAKYLIRRMLSPNGTSMPTPCAVLRVGRGHWFWNLIFFLPVHDV